MRATIGLAFILGIGDCGKPTVPVHVVVDSGEQADTGEEDVPNAEAEAEPGETEDSAEDSGTKSEP